jgi:alkylhydroperoxidase/carboxymuconolactone decarboxylase family protein
VGLGDGTARRFGREPVAGCGYRKDMDHYYDAKDLPRFAEVGKDAPELWEKFSGWYSAVFAEGALTEREKALIALAVSHAVQCPYCIDAYTTGSLEKGATPEQMTEAVHVAAAIRGGASLVHGVQMRNKLEKMSM